jgi:hypothetical protein
VALVRIGGIGTPARASADPDADWIDVRLADDGGPAALTVLLSNPALTVIVRPDRVVATVEPKYRLPRLPWPVPASALCGCAETAHPFVHPASPTTV